MADPVLDLTIALQGAVNVAVQNAMASPQQDITALRSEISALRTELEKLKGQPVDPKPTTPDDKEGTWKNGAGASVHWTPPGGKQAVWSITSGGRIYRDGGPAFEVSLTSNVNGIGIIGGLLCHRTTNGTGYSWTGDQHWRPGARVPQLQVNATIAGAVQATQE